MAEGVDYSFARPSPAGLAAAGKRFAGRYVGPGTGKLLSAPERDALHGAGLDIFLLAEGFADSAAGGYGVGVSHAQSALNAARALGAPDSAAVYFAVDYDVAASAWAAPREYLRGAGSVIGPGRVGVYGKRDVMVWAQRDGVAAWFFQTYAWSLGEWFDGNHVEQYLNGQEVAGGEVDLCRSKVPNFGQWRADGADPGAVFPSFPSSRRGAPDMLLIRAKGTDRVFTYNGRTRTYLGSPAAAAEMQGAGVPLLDVQDVADYGIEFDPAEYYADRDALRAAVAKVNAATGWGGSATAATHDDLVQAAFEGAQRAESE